MAFVKKYKTIILISVFFIMIFISNNSFAMTPTEITEGMSISGAEIHQFEDAGGRIVGVIKVIGTCCSVGMLMVLGIKYMIGSTEEKAEYKKSFLIYILGAVIFFGIFSILDKLYLVINEML